MCVDIILFAKKKEWTAHMCVRFCDFWIKNTTNIKWRQRTAATTAYCLLHFIFRTIFMWKHTHTHTRDHSTELCVHIKNNTHTWIHKCIHRSYRHSCLVCVHGVNSPHMTRTTLDRRTHTCSHTHKPNKCNATQRTDTRHCKSVAYNSNTHMRTHTQCTNKDMEDNYTNELSSTLIFQYNSRFHHTHNTTQHNSKHKFK
jgi:hypothetical protein